MKRVIRYLKKIWFTKIKKEKIYTVLVRGRIKEKNKNFLSLYGEKYVKNSKDVEIFFSREGKGPAVLEIGFGDGKHLAKKAEEESEKIFWGVELYGLGVILTAKKLLQKNITNVSLLEEDARHIIEKSPRDFWQEIYVLFPDPWRKKKHFKRRILKEEFILSLIEKTSAGGKIILATDWESYQEEINESLQKILKEKRKGELSLSKKTHVEIEEGEDILILQTSFAERAFTEGRRVVIFEIQKD